MGVAEWADIATALAAVSGNLLAILLARVVYRQQHALAGSEAAIAWRHQVIELHDRGMTPDQIRTIMLLENGGEGYEEGNGRIDDIVRDIPRRSKSPASPQGPAGRRFTRRKLR
jgi:hypothetical protein